MPSTTPQVGEVWELATNGGRPEQAVVAGTTSTAVNLLARSGRKVAFPIRSFALTWRLVRSAEPAICTSPDCLDQAVVRTTATGWVCENHIPKCQSVRLPGDKLGGEIGAMDNICPCCGWSGAEIFHHLDVDNNPHNHCPNCFGRWVSLWGQDENVEELAATLKAVIRTLRDTGCTEILLRAGTRVVEELKKVGTTIAGVQVQTQHGSAENVSLKGRRPGVRTIVLGSWWRSRERHLQVVGTVAENGIRTLLLIGERRHPGEDVGLVSVSEDELYSVWECSPRQDPSTNVDLPKVGEAWWGGKTELTITSVRSSDARAVRFTWVTATRLNEAGGEVTLTMLAEYFVAIHLFGGPLLVKEQDEVLAQDGTLWVVEKIRTREALLNGGQIDASLFVVPLTDLRDNYRKIVRKSRWEVLLDEDEDYTSSV